MSDANTLSTLSCKYPFAALFQLLPELKRCTTSENNKKFNADTNTLKEVNQHCEDAICVLLEGLQSLGVLLATAADNEDMGISLKDISNIGWLSQTLGELISRCYLVQSDVNEELMRRETNLKFISSV